MQKVGAFLESFFNKIFNSEKLKEKISSIQIFIQEHKVLCLSIAFGLLIIILLLFLFTKSDDKVQSSQSIQNIELEHELVLPLEPTSTKDYYIDRENKDKWDTDEIDQWFTKPQGELLDDLEYQNDMMIQDILEAAP